MGILLLEIHLAIIFNHSHYQHKKLVKNNRKMILQK